MDTCQPVWPKVKDVAKNYFVKLAEVLLPELENNEKLIDEVTALIETERKFRPLTGHPITLETLVLFSLPLLGYETKPRLHYIKL